VRITLGVQNVWWGIFASWFVDLEGDVRTCNQVAPSSLPLTL
jgi:hypothetical protein